MKIAFTAKGIGWDAMIDSRFGRTSYLLIYDDVTDTFEHIDNRAVADEGHGAGPLTARKLFDVRPDVLVTGNGPGGNAAMILAKAGIQIYIGAGEMRVREAFDCYRSGKLKAF